MWKLSTSWSAVIGNSPHRHASEFSLSETCPAIGIQIRPDLRPRRAGRSAATDCAICHRCSGQSEHRAHQNQPVSQRVDAAVAVCVQSAGFVSHWPYKHGGQLTPGYRAKCSRAKVQERKTIVWIDSLEGGSPVDVG